MTIYKVIQQYLSAGDSVVLTGPGCAVCSIGCGSATVPWSHRHSLTPRHHGARVAASRNPLRVSPHDRTATPVPTQASPAHMPPQPHPRVSSWRADAAVRSTPRIISAPTRIVDTMAGWAGGISAPMAIPMAVPGGNPIHLSPAR